MHRSIDQVRVYQTRSSMRYQRAHPTKLFLNKYYCTGITFQSNKKTVPAVRKVVREDPLELLLEKRLRYDPVKSVSLKTREYEKTKKEPKTHKREYLVSPDKQPKKEGQYETGDLVMAKCHGWPYYPAMIVLDPVIRGQAIGPEGQVVKKKPKYVRINKKSNKVLAYHIQFFGNKMFRCWIRVKYLRPFTGWNEWKTKTDKEMGGLVQRKETVAEQKALIREAGAHPSRKADWNLALSEAEKASKLDRFERIELLTYQYVDKIEDEIEEVQ